MADPKPKKLKASLATTSENADVYGKLGKITGKPGATVPAGTKKNRIDWSKAADAVQYLPNIANSLRKPPLPTAPELASPVTLTKINMANQRNEILRQSRGADLGAERTLDSQTSAAVKQSTLAQRMNALNDVSSREANINSQITNQQAHLNAGIEMHNVGLRNQFSNNLTEMKVADIANKSANMANAADKFVGGRNERAKAQLEMDKYTQLINLYKESGVFDRYMQQQKKAGVDDVTGINKQFKTYRMGGKLTAGRIMKKLKY